MKSAVIALLAVLSAAAFPEVAAPAPVSDAAQLARLVETFSDFAGSTQNAQSLAEGLHNGTAVTLIDPSNAPRSFNPVTKPMSWREVRIALAVAQAELAGVGIAEPMPLDIEAVLNGGTAGSGVTMANFTGVLTQRWSGLAWQQIITAHNLRGNLLASSGTSPAHKGAAHAAALSNVPARPQAQGVIATGATARTAVAVVQ